MSEKRVIVLISFRVCIEYICTRVPAVITKESLFDGCKGFREGGGKEMWVTGDWHGKLCECLKLFQYRWSGVIGDGPLANFEG
tara:strand:+ start:1595 stop:1843 length:249 start_codon:yes stop_codon:yes gene_type:complete